MELNVLKRQLFIVKITYNKSVAGIRIIPAIDPKLSIIKCYPVVQYMFNLLLWYTIRVSGVTLYNHFSNSLCLKVSYVTYKGILKRHIIDNDIINLVWTPWVIFYAFILIS